MRISHLGARAIGAFGVIVLLAGCGGGSPASNSRFNYMPSIASVANEGLKFDPTRDRGRIIYTASNAACSAGFHAEGCSLRVNLTNDTLTGFIISTRYVWECSQIGRCFFWGAVTATPSPGNGIVEGEISGYAAALSYGAHIGPSKTFDGSASIMATSMEYPPGYWTNAGVRYLGLVFQVSGRPHYGWAGLSVTASSTGVTTRMTGYAFESRADTPIVAGRTK
ncbi:MAG: hypothetical protein WAK16_01330 [Candidatus Cybelea sp.]